MKKKNFVMLGIGTVGGLLFSIGLCMCLLPEWNAFHTGVVAAAIGAVILLTLLVYARKDAPKKKVNWKLVGKITYGTVSSLVLGVGMCMIMVFEMMIAGMIVGIVGIVMLLGLIPMCIGLK